MNCLAAFMLSAFKGTPSVDVAAEIAKCAGVEIDHEKIKAVADTVQESSIDELINSGLEKLTSVPQGAAVASSGSAGAAASAEEVKEEVKEEEEEEDEAFGFGGLF